MDDAAGLSVRVGELVRGVQPGAHVGEDAQRDADGNARAQTGEALVQRQERDPVDPLQDDVQRPLVLEEVEHVRHVSMLDRGREPRLVQEHRAHARVCSELGEHGLDGDDLLEAVRSVKLCRPDGSHSAPGHAADQLVFFDAIAHASLPPGRRARDWVAACNHPDRIGSKTRATRLGSRVPRMSPRTRDRPRVPARAHHISPGCTWIAGTTRRRCDPTIARSGRCGRQSARVPLAGSGRTLGNRGMLPNHRGWRRARVSSRGARWLRKGASMDTRAPRHGPSPAGSSLAASRVARSRPRRRGRHGLRRRVRRGVQREPRLARSAVRRLLRLPARERRRLPTRRHPRDRPPGARRPPMPLRPPSTPTQVFETTIQPILDTAGGTGARTRRATAPRPGSAGSPSRGRRRREARRCRRTSRRSRRSATSQVPDQSLFYIQATNDHGGIAVSQAQGDADPRLDPAHGAVADRADRDGGSRNRSDAGARVRRAAPAPTSPRYFNLDYFAAEIQPILFGTRQLQPGAGPARRERQLRALDLPRLADEPAEPLPEQLSGDQPPQLRLLRQPGEPELVADLAVPAQRPPRCTVPNGPHPGQDVFSSEQDLNYQRVASWLYSAQPPSSAPAGTQGAASPLDFAWFARQVGHHLRRPGVRRGGHDRIAHLLRHEHVPRRDARRARPRRTCRTSPSSPTRRRRKRSSSTTRRPRASPTSTRRQGSELFLYPTNEIADDDPAVRHGARAPGRRRHRGRLRRRHSRSSRGPAACDPTATATSSTGSSPGRTTRRHGPRRRRATRRRSPRPSSTRPTPSATAASGTCAPRPNELVDLDRSRSARDGPNRVAYAYANVINTTGSAIQASVTVSSPNAVEVFVGSSVALARAGRGPTTAHTVSHAPAVHDGQDDHAHPREGAPAPGRHAVRLHPQPDEPDDERPAHQHDRRAGVPARSHRRYLT